MVKDSVDFSVFNTCGGLLPLNTEKEENIAKRIVPRPMNRRAYPIVLSGSIGYLLKHAGI